MKLISIVVCGATVVVLIAFSANAWFGLSHGHPTAYGTWLHDRVMQDPGDAALLALGVVFWLAFWIWIPNSDKADLYSRHSSWWE